MNNAQRLAELANQLPEPLLGEVLDFAEFLHHKRAPAQAGPTSSFATYFAALKHNPLPHMRNGMEARMIDHSRITLEAGKRGGKPCIRGLRISVYDVLEWMAEGMSEAEIQADHPELEPEDIRAVLGFAAHRERDIASLLNH